MARKDMYKEGVDKRFGQPNGNDNTRGGRKPSIKKELKALLKEEGSITFPKELVEKVNDDGSVTMILPTKMKLAMKLTDWAMSSKGVDSIKAIQLIMEYIDGKPNQNHKVGGDKKNPIKIEQITGMIVK